MKFVNLIALSLCLLMVACSAKTEMQQEASVESSGLDSCVEFNADSAYRNVKAQVDFGPRVPGSEGHARCAEYLVSELERY